MIFQLKDELHKFDSFQKRKHSRLIIEKLCDFGFLVIPNERMEIPRNCEKTIPLTFMALVHGNEVGGIAVLNDLLDVIGNGSFRLHIPFAVLIGNLSAAYKNKRFIDRDLNRSFLRDNVDSCEDERARELEKILAKTLYLMDFHQTSQHSETSFFIGPYTSEGLDFVLASAPRLPIVTHWNDVFSDEGRCSDEYVNLSGGYGFTIELGQNGFSPNQISMGVYTGLGAINYVQNGLIQKIPKKIRRRKKNIGGLFTWSQVVSTNCGRAVLDPGWYNFKNVIKGERLGESDGVPILAESNGAMLFPVYGDRATLKQSAELCRIIRPITFADIEKE
ncbi:MAG: succinylglutamate desuccinylase/aspartoacylase family protein [Oligoflexales bacterium]|nr:succinylglutamate desuccinylase/aspartoacylase family protein [Oligoflexales bacterium]